METTVSTFTPNEAFTSARSALRKTDAELRALIPSCLYLGTVEGLEAYDAIKAALADLSVIRIQLACKQRESGIYDNPDE